MDLLGEAVKLRPLTRVDVDAMEHWGKFSEPGLQWANFDPRSEVEKDIWFASGRDDHARRRLAIVTLDNRLIGTVGLRNINRALGEATLGIRLGAGDVGRGYGTEAVLLILRLAFEDINLHRVNLDVAETNLRARRSYDKVGFRRIGQHIGLDGQRYIDMEISRREFYLKHGRAPEEGAVERSRNR